VRRLPVGHVRGTLEGGQGSGDLGFWDLGFRVQGLRFGVWGLGFGVWGLGFGVWGLGCGV
jgi:hypothetical protein